MSPLSRSSCPRNLLFLGIKGDQLCRWFSRNWRFNMTGWTFPRQSFLKTLFRTWPKARTSHGHTGFVYGAMWYAPWQEIDGGIGAAHASYAWVKISYGALANISWQVLNKTGRHRSTLMSRKGFWSSSWWYLLNLCQDVGTQMVMISACISRGSRKKRDCFCSSLGLAKWKFMTGYLIPDT